MVVPQGNLNFLLPKETWLPPQGNLIPFSKGIVCPFLPMEQEGILTIALVFFF
jgi:hypothetical protein